MRKKTIYQLLIWLIFSFLETSRSDCVHFCNEINEDKNKIYIVKTLELYLKNEVDSIVKINLIKNQSTHLKVYLKDGSSHETPYRQKEYDELTIFEKNIFDYYNFDQKQLVTIIGVKGRDPILLFNKSPKYYRINILNGSFTTEDNYQFLSWEINKTLNEVPELYQHQVKKWLDGYQKEGEHLIDFLFDKNDPYNPILLGICINFKCGKKVARLEYVGPRKYSVK